MIFFAGKILFQRKHLTPVTKRGVRQQTQLGEGIEHESRRIHLIDFVEKRLRGFVQLQFGGMKNGVLAFVRELLFERREFEDREVAQIPLMRFGDRHDLVACLGERDIESFFANRLAGQKELQRERGFAHAGLTAKEVKNGWRGRPP